VSNYSYDYYTYLEEIDAEQIHRDAEEYEQGVRDGETDGRDDYRDGKHDTARVYNPDRTPYLDGYDDGYIGGYHSARKGK
jgi:hypothetical protein